MNSNRDADRLQDLHDSIFSALDNIDDGIFIVSGDRLVEYMNKAAGSIFRPVPCISKDLTFIEVVRDYECDALMRKCIETGDQQSEVIRMHQNNSLLQVTVIRDNDARHYIVVMKDLTERQRLEDIRRDLISNISHEFRTPIASIKLLSETLIDGAGKDTRKSQEFLKKIATEADKLTHMTDELRELAAVEKGGSVLHKGATDIGCMIKHVAERLDAQARAGGLKLETIAEADLPRPVIDGSRVESVLMNLVHNSIKFTDPGGKIVIKAVMDGDNMQVSVSDTGRGIASADLPRVFERFYKVDRSRVGEGSGLGLSISKHIITAHGGRIWVESEERKGSIFYFTLPLSL
jgi:two-component system, OmpR family, phosphate regulon sensor histidine kinase PhoR